MPRDLRRDADGMQARALAAAAAFCKQYYLASPPAFRLITRGFEIADFRDVTDDIGIFEAFRWAW